MDCRHWLSSYRFTVESLAELAGVTAPTVRRWLDTNCVPRSVHRLVELAATTDQMWPGWSIHGDEIYAPTGASASRGQILALPYTLQLLDYLKRENAALMSSPVQYLLFSDT